MHRSRLSVVLIDCAQDAMETGVAFWSGALGMPPRASGDAASPYTSLEGKAGGLYIVLQAVDEAPRFHLDMESDDVEAEVSRLEALGARRVRQIESWWVMQAPTGHLLCVVPPQSDDFPENARVWQT